MCVHLTQVHVSTTIMPFDVYMCILPGWVYEQALLFRPCVWVGGCVGGWVWVWVWVWVQLAVRVYFAL